MESNRLERERERERSWAPEESRFYFESFLFDGFSALGLEELVAR
ncbi:unnamed protein product [Musa banksii]